MTVSCGLGAAFGVSDALVEPNLEFEQIHEGKALRLADVVTFPGVRQLVADGRRVGPTDVDPVRVATRAERTQVAAARLSVVVEVDAQIRER